MESEFVTVPFILPYIAQTETVYCVASTFSPRHLMMEIGAARGVTKAGVARANLAVSNENPCGSKGPHYEKFKDYVCQQESAVP